MDGSWISVLIFPVLCVGFILLILFLSTIRIVRQNHVQIVERFGKFSRILEPGIHVLFPFIDIVARDISLAYQNQIFEIGTVSSDKVLVWLKSNLIYYIDRNKASDFYYNLSSPLETISSFVENYVRSFVSTQTHEELLARRDELSKYLIEHLDKKMSEWGIKINSIQVMDITFPKEITEAMSKVVASQRLKEAAMNEAEAHKIKVVKQAEAEKESRILLGEGVAGERRAIVDGLKSSIDDMKQIPELKTSEVMNLVVVSQYFDTIKAVGEAPNSKVMFLNPAPEGANDLVQSLATAIESTKGNKTNK